MTEALKVKTSKKDELLLYEAVGKTVFEWIDSQNKKGKKPRQSTIIGTLDMVKHDVYTRMSIDSMVMKKINELMKEWKGKRIEIDQDGSLTIIAQREEKQDKLGENNQK